MKNNDLIVAYLLLSKRLSNKEYEILEYNSSWDCLGRFISTIPDNIPNNIRFVTTFEVYEKTGGTMGLDSMLYIDGMRDYQDQPDITVTMHTVEQTANAYKRPCKYCRTTYNYIEFELCPYCGAQRPSMNSEK